MSLKRKLEKILSELQKINGMEGYALIRNDGYPFIKNFKSDIDLVNLSSACASINKSGEKVEYNTIIIEYTEGNNIIIRKQNKETMLVCLTSKNVNLSELLQRMKELNTEINKILI